MTDDSSMLTGLLVFIGIMLWFFLF